MFYFYSTKRNKYKYRSHKQLLKMFQTSITTREKPNDESAVFCNVQAVVPHFGGKFSVVEFVDVDHDLVTS